MSAKNSIIDVRQGLRYAYCAGSYMKLVQLNKRRKKKILKPPKKLKIFNRINK